MASESPATAKPEELAPSTETSSSSSSSKLPLPYEVKREWPSDWSLATLFKKEKTEMGGRYLHPKLEVKSSAGRGRGVFATATIEPGELIVFDEPLLLAPKYEELLTRLVERTKGDQTFREMVLSMCGDPSDTNITLGPDAEPSRKLLENIIRHNYHGIDEPPIDGELKSGAPLQVGLWPLGSLFNHSLRPNVTRSFAGHCLSCRAIRPINAGEEVFDNYLDLRMPRSQRREMMRRNHGIDDEGPDDCDAPPAFIEEILQEHADAMVQLSTDKQEDAQAVLGILTTLTNKIMTDGHKDPALSDVFRDFGIVAGQLGDLNMSLEALAMALEFATSREPYNIISYVLTLRLLHMSILAEGEEGADDMRRSFEALAKEHCRMVFGRAKGTFEALNPDIFAMLNEAKRGKKPRTE